MDTELMLDVGQANEIKLAARRAGATNADLKKLSEGDVFAKILRVLRGRAEVVIKSILTFLRTVRVASHPGITASEEYFQEAGVKVMGDNFKAQFLGLKVPAADGAELAVHRLEEASLDAPIRAELGEKTEISVSQFQAFLAANRESPEWFIFYLNKDGKPWAVGAYWLVGRGGWFVGALSVADPGGRSLGRQVVSQV